MIVMLVIVKISVEWTNSKQRSKTMKKPNLKCLKIEVEDTGETIVILGNLGSIFKLKDDEQPSDEAEPSDKE